MCLALVPSLTPHAASAHRDGCHRWHSCPSDSGSYECGDARYACRYPTYDESERGKLYDPTYEDYGSTDRDAPDRDYSRIVQGIPARDAPASPYDLTVDRTHELTPVGSTAESSTDGAGTSLPWGWIAVALGGVAWLLMMNQRPAGSATRTATSSSPPTPYSPPVAKQHGTRPKPKTSRSGPPKARQIRGGCPCGGRLTVRARRSDGHRFIGCSNFPRCRRTRNL